MMNDNPCEVCGRPRFGETDCAYCLFGLAQAPASQAGPVSNPRIDLEALNRALPQLDILETLGQGASGVVLKALDRELGQLVAVKVLAHEKTTEPQFVSRFLQEARTLAALDHPGILKVLHYGHSAETCYLILEYVEGTSLRDLMAASGLDSDRVLSFMPQLCDALQYAHDQGVVHRDIKPENILVGPDDELKIADFGIARLLGDDDAARLTQTEILMGTPHYMAPEQLNDPLAVDHRADIFALGVLLYEMLTGELPIGRFAPASESSRVDRNIDSVIDRALESEPSRRYQRVAQLRSDLVALVRLGSSSQLALGAEGEAAEAERLEQTGDYQHSIAKASDSGVLHLFLGAIFGGLLLTFGILALVDRNREPEVLKDREIEKMFLARSDRVPFYRAALIIKEGTVKEVSAAVTQGIERPVKVPNDLKILMEIAENRGHAEILKIVTVYCDKILHPRHDTGLSTWEK